MVGIGHFLVVLHNGLPFTRFSFGLGYLVEIWFLGTALKQIEFLERVKEWRNVEKNFIFAKIPHRC